MAEARPLQIPVPKAGKEVTVEIDPNEVMAEWPEDTIREILTQGLKVVLNRGQTKLKSVRNMTDKADAEAEAKAIVATVEKQIELCKAGKIKVTGGKTKAAGSRSPERVIAMQLARQAVKDELKRRNMKPSHYAQSEISKMAEQLLQSGSEVAEEILADAKEEAERREARKQKASDKLGIDVGAMEVDEALVAKAKKPRVAPEVAAQVVQGVRSTRRPEARH
jgi:hypothetical protein